MAQRTILRWSKVPVNTVGIRRLEAVVCVGDSTARSAASSLLPSFSTSQWSRHCSSGSATAAVISSRQQRCQSLQPLLYHSSATAQMSRGEYYKLRHHKKAAQACPYEVLGLPRHGKAKKEKALLGEGSLDSSAAQDDNTSIQRQSNDYDEDGAVLYRAVKAAFLKIAMAHHPDTTEAETQEELDAHRDVFIKAREAFEQIVAGPNGVAILRSESPDHASDEEEDNFDVDAWFQNETGHAMPFMDLQTMKEVAKMTETVGHGLDRDGGMWLLAEMVSDSVKKGGAGDGASILRLEAGDSTGSSNQGGVDGVLRRRRRRDR